MTVTDIKREKGHIVNVTLSNGKTLCLDVDFCAEKCIHKGDEILNKQAKEYCEESDYLRAKSRALWLLDRYSYTERKLFEKLKSAGFPINACAKAIARLKELGVIDDGSLSERYAEDLARRGISKREAYQKLLVKGFDADTVKCALQKTDFDETKQIADLLERKYKNRILSGETDKVYGALVRKGFSFGAVREALKKYSDELLYLGDG